MTEIAKPAAALRLAEARRLPVEYDTFHQILERFIDAYEIVDLTTSKDHGPDQARQKMITLTPPGGTQQ